jgi:hypothetical protein
MALHPDLFRAILVMDSYNRGYGAGLAGLSDSTGTQIGLATVFDTKGDPAAQAAGFYGIAYNVGTVPGFTAGEKVIAYRGTETASMRRSHAGRECLVAVAVSCHRSDLEDFPCFRENLQGKRAFLGFVKMATPTLLQ